MLFFKKFAAVVLFGLYTFNLFGYLLLFHLMEQRAAQHLQTSLDKETYAEADLMALTVPLSLPYVTDTKDFERIDGEITIEGKIYHYVKRGIKNGELVLLCLPDHQKMKIENAKQQYSNLANDFQTNNPSKKNQSKEDPFKNIRLKYCPNSDLAIDFILPISFYKHSFPYYFSTINRQKDLPDHPPELS